MRLSRRGYDEHKGEEALCELVNSSSFDVSSRDLENLKRIGLGTLIFNVKNKIQKISGYFFGPDSRDDRDCFTRYGRFKADLLIDAIENGLMFINLKVRAVHLSFSILSFTTPRASS